MEIESVLLSSLITMEGWQQMLSSCVMRQGMPVVHYPEFFALPIFGRRSAITGPFGVMVRYCYLCHEGWSNFMQHEKIHYLQWWECLIILYPVIFLIEFTIYSIIFWDLDKGYAFTAFEQEAYIHQNEQGYLKRRIPFTWIMYLFIKRRVWEEDPDILSKNFPEAQLRHLEMEEKCVA